MTQVNIGQLLAQYQAGELGGQNDIKDVPSGDYRVKITTASVDKKGTMFVLGQVQEGPEAGQTVKLGNLNFGSQNPTAVGIAMQNLISLVGGQDRLAQLQATNPTMEQLGAGIVGTIGVVKLKQQKDNPKSDPNSEYADRNDMAIGKFVVEQFPTANGAGPAPAAAPPAPAAVAPAVVATAPAATATAPAVVPTPAAPAPEVAPAPAVLEQVAAPAGAPVIPAVTVDEPTF